MFYRLQLTSQILQCDQSGIYRTCHILVYNECWQIFKKICTFRCTSVSNWFRFLFSFSPFFHTISGSREWLQWFAMKTMNEINVFFFISVFNVRLLVTILSFFIYCIFSRIFLIFMLSTIQSELLKILNVPLLNHSFRCKNDETLSFDLAPLPKGKMLSLRET